MFHDHPQDSRTNRLHERFTIIGTNKKMSTIHEFPTRDSFISMQNSDICTLAVVVVNLELNTVGYKLMKTANTI